MARDPRIERRKLTAEERTKKQAAVMKKRRQAVVRKPGRMLRDLREEMLAESPELRKAWEALETKRRIVSSLLRLRHQANLTQAELAQRAGWQRSFVSRLESFPRAGEQPYIPDLATLMRYAEVCDSNLGLVFAEPRKRGKSLHVSAVTALGESSGFIEVMDDFTGADVGVKRRAVQEKAGDV